MRTFIFRVLLFFSVYAMFLGCARRGTPTGGLKDTIPPVLLKAIPNMESLNFKEQKIKIYFDEYIKLKDLKKQLVISPPLKYDPIITPVGTASKIINLKILDTLDTNTTYVLNFGKSIVDNNEENPLGNFKYVFSTGKYIDSLDLKGAVNDPLVKKTEKNMDVMLYEYNEAYNDSVIYKQKPRYIANTLDSTLFELTHLKAGKYLLIALKDANFNKIYNPEIDKIGFVNDTVTLPTDKKYDFTIFKEVPKVKVFKPVEVNKGHVLFGFQGRAKDLIIKLLTETTTNFKSEVVYEKNKDTLHYWYTPFTADSLNFNVSKGEYSENFTVRLRSSTIDSLKIKNNTGNILHLIDTFSISSTTPIISVDTSLIKIRLQDSTLVNYKSILAENKSTLLLHFEQQNNTNYNIQLLPNSINDIFGLKNDTLTYNIKTKSPEDYGNINFEVKSNKNKAFVVNLLTDKGKLVRTTNVSKPGTVTFKLLSPGNYNVRVTIDENNNGKWDTGNFLEKKQAEVIKYFDKTIELRANWDVNESFSID